MTEQRKKIYITSGAALLAVITAYCFRIVGKGSFYPTLFSYLRSFIYIGLFAAWGLSVRQRIVQAQVRRYLTGASVLLIFWMASRSAKYFIFWQPDAIRYLWYLYYLPMLFVPMLALLIAMSLGKPDEYRLPKATLALWAVSGAMLLLVLTNDLHQLVFTFPEDAAVWTDRDNGYAVGYFITVGWQVMCAVAALIIMFIKCRLQNGRRNLLPLIPLLLSLGYSAVYYTGVPWLRSLFGDIAAFQSLMYSLKSNHPKEWDRNTNYREQFFRSQIYSIFNDSRFICIDRPVVIKGTDGRTITDLDAVIIDKQSKQTALFQLKWQDPTNDTVFSLKSKAENYINSTRTWVNQVLHWIATSSNEEIARVLNVKKQYIHKETLFIFVMGRTHGNYSSENELSSASNVVYGQWYQFLKISTYLSQHDQLSLVNLFKIMTETVPNKTRIIERQTVFKYDRYHIHFGGGFFR